MKPIVWLLFHLFIKMVFLQKTISNMADKSKDIKKHQNAPTKHTERVKHYYVDF